MSKTISMQDMRHLNLFDKITHVRTSHCFKYNNTIMFGVPKSLVLQSIGRQSENLRKIGSILRTRVKVIPLPKGEEDIKAFIQKIIEPVSFKEIEVKNDEVIVTAGSQNKAALIGRNKRRMLEMQKIIREFFGKEFRIV